MIGSLYELATTQLRAYATLRRVVADFLKKYNLTPKEWLVLNVIIKKNLKTPIEISQFLQFEKPYITYITQDLEKKSFIKIVQDTVDRRKKVLGVSQEMLKNMTIIEEKMNSTLKALLTPATKEDLESYFKVLQTIIYNAKADGIS